MNKSILFFAILLVTTVSSAQISSNIWKTTSIKTGSETVENKLAIANPDLYELDIVQLQE